MKEMMIRKMSLNDHAFLQGIFNNRELLVFPLRLYCLKFCHLSICPLVAKLINLATKYHAFLHDISKDARDFLKGCFVRKSRFKMTSETLLNHPFVRGLEDNEAIEDVEEPEGLNEIETILVVSESDYELSPGSYSDEWGYTSDGDSFSYWTDEDVSYCENKVMSDFVEEVELEKLESITNSSIDAGLSQSTEASSEVSPIPFLRASS